MATFIEKSRAQWKSGRSVCVGLDPEMSKIPPSLRKGTPREIITSFLIPIIDATKDIAGFFKPNSAFFESEGTEGWQALSDVCAHLHAVAPDVPIILDAKRGDIGSTNEGYVRMAFDSLGVDAITVHPYLGREALEPFFARKDKGIIVLVKTSNHGSGEFQDLKCGEEAIYEIIARHVVEDWNANGNCGVVVGSTYPQELRRVRAIVGDMPILMPGVGAQGADIDATVKAGKGSDGVGMIVNSSRGILFASSGEDFAQAARTKALELHSAIHDALLE